MKWISVKDKLPEHRNVIMVCAKVTKEHPFFGKIDKFWCVVIYFDREMMKKEMGNVLTDDFGSNSIWASLEVQGMSLNNVTHWCYLPELPEDE